MSSIIKLPMRKLFSERLKSMKEARAYKSAEMANFLGFSQPVYSRYENGRIPDVDTVSAIADKCGVTVDWLLGRDESATLDQLPTLGDRQPKTIYGAAAESALAKQDQAKKAAWAKMDDAIANAFVDTCYDMSKLISTGRSVDHASEVIREQLDGFVDYGRAVANGQKKG